MPTLQTQDYKQIAKLRQDPLFVRYTYSEAAQLLGVSRYRLDLMIKTGKIVQMDHRISLAEITRYLKLSVKSTAWRK
jgi:hypothetical protein